MTMMKVRLTWMSRRDRRLWRSASTVAELGLGLPAFRADVSRWMAPAPKSAR
ncbi:MAG: hypothetical protein JWO67_803 [Streptosporangiaceae bacterium]|nr:hypothetical protein [Streptosporangiaceae bacterium]